MSMTAKQRLSERVQKVEANKQEENEKMSLQDRMNQALEALRREGKLQEASRIQFQRQEGRSLLALAAEVGNGNDQENLTLSARECRSLIAYVQWLSAA